MAEQQKESTKEESKDDAKEEPKVHSLACPCGKLKMVIQGQLRYRVQCLCVDCRARVICSKVKNPAIQELTDYKRGVDAYYFGNALLVSDEAKKLVDFFKVKDDANSINMKSSCCGQLMAVINPCYIGNVIYTTPDGPNLTLAPGTEIPKQSFSIWPKDFPGDKKKALPADSPVDLDFNDPESLKANAARVDEYLTVFKTAVPAERKTKDTVRFEDLLTAEWKKEFAAIQEKMQPMLKSFGLV
eukprot:CAMPEP_0202712978 /NCGR_PEP_ID=MMETSP1385-20130828/47780_1 /ASSEMBLY_ACC=CAM_ASM_000861 /TAXON_ID=933848 /ORGANISM="Elphidium margaritaceum" /LENGTH=242 /DNA_ID=CAMNT_0049373183 /DNA_START=26 /DNA_END=754 /DNA_ORIENTATION=-